MGNYEAPLEQPAASGTEIDLVCFTDDPWLTSDTWEIRPIEAALPMDCSRSSRRPKILAHHYLPGYDESLYIDNSVLLKRPPEELFEALLPAGADFAVFEHSHRGPLAEEFASVVEAGLDAPWVCDEQMEHYRSAAPEVLGHPTFWGGILLRRHGRAEVQRSMEQWWEHVLRYSRRDQLSLPLVLSQSSSAVVVHAIDNHRSEFHEWPVWPPGTARGTRSRVWDAEIPVLKELRDRIAEMNDELESLREEAASSREGLAQTCALVEELLGSTSWKVTGPGRLLSRQVKARLQRLRSEAVRLDADCGPASCG